MHRIERTVISLVLAVAVMLPFCSCNKSPKIYEQTKAFAEAYCAALKSGNAALLMTYIDDPSVTEADIKNIISPEGLNSEQSAFVEAVRETNGFTVGGIRIENEINIAFVQINWTQGNYYSEAAMSAQNIDDFKAALAAERERVVVPTVSVEFGGDTLKIKNAKEDIDLIYEFTSVENKVMPGLLSDYYVDGDTVLAPKGVYTNTDTIGVRLNFDNVCGKYRFIPGVRYTVAYGNEVIYVSDVVDIEDDTVRLDLGPGILDSEYFNADSYLKAGTYTFVVFDEHSNDIASFECKVLNEDVEKEEISFEEHKKDYYLSDLVYEFGDSDLMAHTFVYNSGWWDYDGTSVGKSAFASNTKTLGFSLSVSKENQNEFFYEYYYSSEADFSDIDITKPVYNSSCKPTVYDDQACYDLDYTPAKALEPGFYGLVVYSDANKKHIVFTAQCIVVEETSGDVTGG